MGYLNSLREIALILARVINVLAVVQFWIANMSGG